MKKNKNDLTNDSNIPKINEKIHKELLKDMDKRMKEIPKACTDCEFYKVEHKIIGKCTNPILRNLIDGRFGLCLELRYDKDALCGRNAIYFKEKSN